MGTSRRSALRFVSPLLALMVAGLGVASLACYKPSIADGRLRCNLDAGTHACPEGFKCETSSGLCKRNPSDAGPEVVTDAGDGGRDVGDAMDAEVSCYQPVANCTATPDAGTCDPFCQTGCGCREKCSVNTAGALTCKALAAGQVRALLQPCQIQAAGTDSQSDQCAPGLVCVEDSCGGGGGSGRCYQFCRRDSECNNAPCNRDIGGGFTVCDVPYVDCVPLPASSNTGCLGNALACYLSTSNPSKTICDCEFPPGLREGDVCTRSRECNPGLVCVINGQGARLCTRVCRLQATPSDCVGTCKTYMDNGVANMTYGYCG